ncbi:hypothetical protein BU16DRAFT_619763 [Lophium mytilinum]|uniref:Deacetylase complex subunit Sds3 n=1 Tax=Lophium mytilinum TaxID=390894 RepID=A0A6A6QM21_9PEZI|nr:hypothetical protein BU16DRAFT_619763 [Lophium mytilinum]
MARNRSISPADGFPLGHSATSPQPQVSKRDKRRNMLSDKLQEMVASFADNRDTHYKAQLAAVQADMNLIMRADPYANKPLEDSGEEAAELIQTILGNHTRPAPSAETDYVAQVGSYYSRFVEAVNDAMEERDYNLTMLWNKHQSARLEHENTHQYKVRVAEEEHRLLAATVRERLTQSITARRARLLREKEQLDLADSNALLLHPNQFSITNPASPGGVQSNRKTRHTRHRIDPDDLAGAAAANENKKKRKLFEAEDNGSPGPSGRNADLGTNSPFRDAKARTIHTQFEASAYSIERLFTEKELAMSMNNAAIAAAHFFAKMKNADNTTSQDPTTNGTNGVSHDNGSDNEANSNEIDHESDSPPGPPDMLRTMSQSHHATRGATRSALGDLASLATRSYPFTAAQPIILPANIGSKPNAAAPSPAPLQAQDAEQDFMIIFRDAPANDALNEKLLADAVAPLRTREYQYQPPGWQPPVPEITTSIRTVAPHLEVGIGGALSGMGGVTMSAQSSMGGFSEIGGVAMNRFGEGSSLGGVGMRRTASGAGYSEIGEDSGPVRGTGSGRGRRGGRRGG